MKIAIKQIWEYIKLNDAVLILAVLTICSGILLFSDHMIEGSIGATIVTIFSFIRLHKFKEKIREMEVEIEYQKLIYKHLTEQTNAIIKYLKSREDQNTDIK
jgi:hypothetical protein